MDFGMAGFFVAPDRRDTGWILEWDGEMLDPRWFLGFE